MKYILKSPDGRWHLDSEGNVTPDYLHPPQVFPNTESAYARTKHHPAYADLRIHGYLEDELKK
jgi:hypothetical protein